MGESSTNAGRKSSSEDVNKGASLGNDRRPLVFRCGSVEGKAFQEVNFPRTADVLFCITNKECGKSSLLLMHMGAWCLNILIGVTLSVTETSYKFLVFHRILIVKL